jgi:hypothetical protein
VAALHGMSSGFRRHLWTFGETEEKIIHEFHDEIFRGRKYSCFTVLVVVAQGQRPDDMVALGEAIVHG